MAQCWTPGCNRQAEPNTPFCKECMERFIREHPESGTSEGGRVGLQGSQHHEQLARSHPQIRKPEASVGSTASASTTPPGSLLESTPHTCDEYEKLFMVKCKTRGCFNRAESIGGYCKECGEKIRKAQEEEKRRALEKRYVDEVQCAQRKQHVDKVCSDKRLLSHLAEAERRRAKQRQMQPLVDLGITALKHILKW